jgi:hypothetical protein
VPEKEVLKPNVRVCEWSNKPAKLIAGVKAMLAGFSIREIDKRMSGIVLRLQIGFG